MREKTTYTYCLIRMEDGKTLWYISDIPGLKAGDAVEVPVGSDEKLFRGTVDSVGEYALQDVPYPLSGTRAIRRKIAEDELVSADGDYLLSSGGKVLEKYIGQTRSFETTKYTFGIKLEGKRDPKIVIPEGVEEIRPRAFQNIFTLQEVVLPESLKIIGDEAFGETGIKKITIPAGVERIGYAAFTHSSDEYGLEHVHAEMVISKDNPFLYSDGRCVFRRNDDGTQDLVLCFKTGLTKYDVPAGTARIYAAAFLGCKRLTTLTLNDGLRQIGREAVRYCSQNMRSIALPDSVEDITDLPFTTRTVKPSGYYSYLDDLTLKIDIEVSGTNPHFLKDGAGLYARCDSGKLRLLSCDSDAGRLDIKAGTAALGDRAFETCRRLKEITVPESLEEIEAEDLSEYFPPSLTKIEVSRANADFSSDSGVLYNADRTKLLYVPKKLSCKELKVPESVRDIGTAFARCEKIGSVVLPAGLTRIAKNAFLNAKIRSFTVPASVKEIDGRAFVLSKDLTAATVYGVPGSAMESYCKTRKKLTFLPIPASGGKPAEKLDYEFQAVRGGVAISKYTGSGKKLKIPSEIAGMTVTEVRGLANYGNRSIKSVELPDTVTVLGEDVFRGLESLETLKLPAGLTSIPYRMCERCEALKEIVIPETVTEIGAWAFAVSGIKTLTLPTGIKRLPIGIISGCAALEELRLPEGLETLEAGALYGIEVNKVVIPASVTEIDEKVFEITGRYNPLYRWNLKDNDIMFCVEKDSCADRFFSNFKATNPEAASTMTVMYDEQLATSIVDLSIFHVSEQDGCTVIEDIDEVRKRDIVIPETINGLPVTRVNIEDGKWHGKNFESIDFPSRVKELTFSTNISISRILFSRGNNTYWSDGSVLYTADKTKLIRVTNYSIKSYVIPDGTASAADEAFSRCYDLRRLKLPSSFRYFFPKALSGLTGPIKLVGGEKLEEPEPGYFEELTNSRGSWVDRLTIIGVLGHTFMHADPKEKKVVIPEGVEDICDDAFSSINGADCCVEEIILPSTLKRLTTKCFSSLDSMKKIELPEGITEIPEAAFKYCRKLEHIKLPSTVRTIKVEAFSCCYALKSIELPEGLVSIEDSAFEYCNNLTEIELPPALTRIGKNALKTSGLRTIHVAPGNRAFRVMDDVLFSGDGSKLIRIPEAFPSLEYTVPDGVTEISAHAMESCSNIQSLIFPDNVKKIGDSACAYMKTLEYVRLPKGVTELPDMLFAGCDRLANVSMSEKIRSVGDGCFSGCSGLSVSLSEVLEIIGSSAFANTKPRKIALPASVKEVGYGAFAGYPEIEVAENDYVSGLGYAGANQITVKSASTGEIIYRLWLPTRDQMRDVFDTVCGGLKKGTKYNFALQDKNFTKINDTAAKFRVALTRLAYPEGLTQESREMYTGYVRQMGAKIATACIENGDLEGLRAAAEFGAVKRSNIDKLVEAAANAGRTELTAFLLDFKNKSL